MVLQNLDSTGYNRAGNFCWERDCECGNTYSSCNGSVFISICNDGLSLWFIAEPWLLSTQLNRKFFWQESIGDTIILAMQPINYYVVQMFVSSWIVHLHRCRIKNQQSSLLAEMFLLNRLLEERSKNSPSLNISQSTIQTLHPIRIFRTSLDNTGMLAPKKSATPSSLPSVRVHCRE